MSETDFECRFCAAVFPERDRVRGNCPNCGGIAPVRKEIPPEILIKYVYVTQPSQPNQQSHGYYRPKSQSLSQTAYSTLGFKVVSLSIVAILAIFIYVFVQALRIGTPNELTDEQNRFVAPTVAAVQPATATNEASFLSSISEWMTSAESLQLREQSGVVNLVLLDQDEVRYAKSLTVELDDTWVLKRPYFVEAVSVQGTATVVQIGGQRFNINTYQPFIWGGNSEELIIVDHHGNLWAKNANNVTLVDLGAVQTPITIEPNPNLELAFTKN